MRLFITLLFLTLATGLVSVENAWGSDLEDLDSTSNSKRAKPVKEAAQATSSEREVIREINKGFFLKANAGTTAYLGNRSALLSSGTTLALAGGSDFIDRENMSMAWELVFEQGLHNGMKFDEQGALLAAGQISANQLIQGDIHTFAAIAMIEASWYLNRRFGIGIRGGGGVMLTPLLVFEDSYKNVIIPTSWGNQRPAVHDSPHPMFGGGPTFEYYTKLSHFSIGADVNAFYALGFDLGVSATGYLKYTF
jgi:hypothetical protein